MDHSLNTLTAAIKSLQDAVEPAVDRNDPLARQQLAMVIDFLGFLRSRLPYLHTRAWLELRSAHQLASGVTDQVVAARSDLSAPLAEAVATSERLLVDPATSNGELEDCRAALLAVLREGIRACANANGTDRRRLLRAVLDDSECAVSFTRSWYLPLGFDPYPDQVASLDRLIETQRSDAAAG